MTDRDKRQGGRPFKPGGRKPATGAGAAGGRKPSGEGKPFREKRASADRDDPPRRAGKTAEGRGHGGKFSGGKSSGGKSSGGKSPGAKPYGGKPRGAPKRARELPEAPPKAHAGERIAKAMARAGACSRRDAEEWIAAGRVAVNGRTLESPAFNVVASDKITIDGRPLAARDKTRLFLFHKPRGLVTTDHDPEGRQTIFDYLAERHPELPRLMSVGRLDINTEGLLLMTNDGGLARTLELPQTGWLRRYRVRAHGETDQAALDTLARGVRVDDVDYAPIEAKLDRVQGANAWLTLGLREGKNREVRRVLGSLGLDVNRLIRVSYGPFQLGDLAEGAVEEVRTRVLRDQLGPSLIAQSLAEFDTPAREEDEDRKPRARRDDRPREREFQRPRREAFARDDRRASDERFARDEAPKKVERPKPGVRKHVSTLRAEREERLQDERVKIERRETADRKGRAVVVERVVPAKPKEEPVETRNARRFKAERDAAGGRGTGRGRPRDQRPASARDGERPMRRRPDEASSDRRRAPGEERPRTARRDEGRSRPRASAERGIDRRADAHGREDRPARRFQRDDRGEDARGGRPARREAASGERKGRGQDPAPRDDRRKGPPRNVGRTGPARGDDRKGPPRGGSGRGERPGGGARPGSRPPRGKR